MIYEKPVVTVVMGGTSKEAQTEGTGSGGCILFKVGGSFLFRPGDKGRCLGQSEGRRKMNRVALVG